MLKKFKKVIALGICVMMVFAMVACGSDGDGDTGKANDNPPAEDLVIKLGHTESDNENSMHNTACVKFAELVEEYSEGRITVEVHPNGELGGERDMIEGMQIRTLDMASVASMVVGNFDPSFAVFDLPYLFPDLETTYKVLDSDYVLNDMNESLASKAKVRVLGYGIGGFRYIASNKKIESLEDVKGMKIRVPENSVYVDSYNALGAVTTTMAIGEVITGLQQGTVDGFEMCMTPLYTNGFYDLLDHIALTGVNCSVNPLIISEELFQSLSTEDQEILKKAAQEAAAYEREIIGAYIEEVQPLLEKEGVSLDEIKDIDAFKKATEGVIDKHRDEIGSETIDAIMNLINE